MRSSGYDSMLSLAWGLVWIPGQRTKILHVTWHGQKKKKSCRVRVWPCYGRTWTKLATVRFLTEVVGGQDGIQGAHGHGLRVWNNPHLTY